MNIDFFRLTCFVLLALAFGNARSADDNFLGFYTLDYSADNKKNVEYMGASVYERTDGSLQSKFSVQIALQDDRINETKTFFGVAASSRYRFGISFAPFIGIGAFYGQTDVCDDHPEEEAETSTDDGAGQGDEACYEDQLLAGFTEYGINWLITGNLFIEAARRQNHTSKSEPFDSAVNAFSIGFRY